MNILILRLVAFSDGGFVYILIPVAVVIFLIMMLGWKLIEKIDTEPEARKARESFETQALKRQGIVKDDASGLKPELSFRHDGSEFSVSIREGGKGDPRVTFVSFQTELFPEVSFRIASGKFKALISRTRIKDFDGDLCRHYQLEGNDAAFINSLLTQEIQDDLLEYQTATEVRFGMHTGVKLALKPGSGRFYLSTEGFQVEDKDYNRLIETTVKVYERLKIMAMADGK